MDMPGRTALTLTCGSIVLLVKGTVVHRGVEKRQLPLVQTHSGSLVDIFSVPSLMNVTPLMWSLDSMSRGSTTNRALLLTHA